MDNFEVGPKKVPQRAAGGRARAEALSPRKRSDIAKKAARARWSTDDNIVPRATHEGMLATGGIPCAVLDDGRRVLSQRGVGRALGRQYSSKLARAGKIEGGDPVPFFLAGETLKPFIPDDLLVRITKPIVYTASGGIAHGVEASVLTQICEVWLKARDAEKLLRPAQKRIAAQADALMRAFAQVGIVALVDEATGYQEVRPRDALERYLEKILRKELAVWSKRFPDEFYENIYRLKGWQWAGMSKNRYSVVAHYTRDLVYERLAPSLLKELEVKNPRNEKGERPSKFHQWLTDDIGHPMLAQHLHSVIMFQRLAIANGHGWSRFVRSVDKVMAKKEHNLELPHMENDDERD